MKVIIMMFLLVIISCEDNTSTKNVSQKLDTIQVDKNNEDMNAITEAEEDCDDKFKKSQEEEKVIDENNLFGKQEADEGCTLE